jgi:hypothetical protein
MTPKQTVEALSAFVASSPPVQQTMAAPNLDLCLRLLNTDNGVPEIKGKLIAVVALFKVSGQLRPFLLISRSDQVMWSFKLFFGCRNFSEISWL